MPYKNIKEQRDYQAKWMADRRADWIRNNGPCKRCGSWDNLEIDHIDRNIKISHRIWSWTEARRLNELAKCQVLCEKCHLVKSREFGDLPPERRHGTYPMYRHSGCRCDPCRKAGSEYAKQLKLRKQSVPS